ncbi:DEAD/DEAH box helicase [Alkalicoccus urumqiensis]|nr:DEAD/DEAH box helicase [Alkalicoccus urumqiensis]
MFRIDQLTEEQLVQHIENPSALSVARVYQSEGSVRDIFWDHKNKQLLVYVVRYQTKFRVRFQIDVKGRIEPLSCTCERGTLPCSHALAALLELSRKDFRSWLEQRGMDFDMEPVGLLPGEQRMMQQFLHKIESLYLPEENEEDEPAGQMIVEFYIRLLPASYSWSAGSVQLEMKAGRDRMYIVKNMHEFLRAVREKESYRFTDKFTYYPGEYTIDPDTEAMLHKLYRLMETQQMYQPDYLRYQRKDTRYIELPPSEAPAYLKEMEHLRVYFEDGTPFVLREMEKPFQFFVRLEDNVLTLDWAEFEDVYYFGEKLPILVLDAEAYTLSDDKHRIVDSLYDAFAGARGRVMRFDQAALGRMASVLFPQLNEIGTVHVEEGLEEKITMEPLRPELHLTYPGKDRMTAEVNFRYGEKKINPFVETAGEDDTVLVRDVKEEYRLVHLIETAPFKFNGSELFLDSFRDILQFVHSWLPYLSRAFDVFAPDDLLAMVHHVEEEPDINVELAEASGWMEMSFSIEGISERDVEAVLEALMKKEEYIQLEDGAYLPLTSSVFDGIRSLADQWGKNKGEGAVMTAPLYQAFELDEMEHVRLKHSRELRQLFTRLLEPEELDFALPDMVDADLRDYQKKGYQWMTSLAYYGMGGILADDMGLGKTLQTITFLAGRKERGEQYAPALILCPASVVYNWMREVEKFAPSLQAVVVSGSRAEREKQRSDHPDADIFITSYPSMRRDEEIYAGQQFGALILDEAQNVKNAQTKTAAAVRKMNSGVTFALSGTPIENSLEELYSIFSIALPGLLPGKKAFSRWKEEKIKSRIRPFVMRRRKVDVLKELPDKLEAVEYTDLTRDQKTLYMGQLKLLQTEAKDAIARNAWQEQRMQILAGLTRLRQICCHPGMFIEDYSGGSEKLERLMDYIHTLLEDNHRIVIFSQFTKMLSIIRSRLDEEKRNYFYLDGNTPSKDRVVMADAFNHGEKELFLVSLKAGGTGLNLTGGDTVILFDSWWNPAVEDQAADRVYRYGQKRVVTVTKMVTAGTIEEKIHQMQEQKRDLLDRVVQPGETMLNSLGREEIEALLEL